MPDVRQPSFHGFIGIARAEITPPLGIYARTWAASEHDVADEVHRPLTATVLTLRNERTDEPLVLCALDLGWWRRKEDEWYVRGHLIEQLAIDPARVIVALSHTHAGPSISLEDVDKPGGHVVRPYLNLMRDTLVELARESAKNAKQATLSWVYGRCRLARNRDQMDPELGIFVNGYEEFAPSDPVVLVGKVETEAGETLGTIVNYACHPTTLGWENRWISPDYVGAMRELVEERAGGICMFLQGASGELAPKIQYTNDPALADQYGRELGYAVLSALESMIPAGQKLAYQGMVESGSPLGVWDAVPDEVPSGTDATIYTVEIPLQALPSCEEIAAQMEETDDRRELENLRNRFDSRHNIGPDDSVRIPLYLWSAGDVLFLGVPGEPYSLIQRHLRLHFIDRAVCVMNVANGWYGYFPPRELYEKPIPAVKQTPFAKGALEFVIHGSLTQLERLSRSRARAK